MDTALLLILQIVLWQSAQALFTVEVTKLSHQAEFGGNVTMECTFVSGGSESSLSVFWRRISPEPPMEVYKLEKGKENLSTQDPHYRERVRLLRNELKRGRAMLEISNLRINDSGTYQCLVEMGGADYKQTTLTVKASYKSISKSIRRSGRDGVELECDSRGYPQAGVVWTDGSGRNLTLESNTTAVAASNQLFHITSRINVKISNNNYTCAFVEEGLMGQSIRFHIPEEIPQMVTGKNSLVAIILIAGIIAVCVVGGGLYVTRKGYKKHSTAGTTDCLIPDDLSSARLSQEKNTDIPTVVKENEGAVENVREALRRRYAAFCSDAEAAEQRVRFCETVLPRCLKNRGGLALGVDALLPKPGETLVLEGDSRSGKTIVALSLATVWAGNSHRDPFGVRQIQLVILLTCKESTGDLFQEMMSQLSLDGEFTVETLREVLTGPVEVLLVLDGYEEGNRVLDESLRVFLKEAQARRVLLTTRPGQCARERERLRTVLLLPPKDALEGQGLC